MSAKTSWHTRLVRAMAPAVRSSMARLLSVMLAMALIPIAVHARPIEVVVPKQGRLGYLPRTSTGAPALLMDLTDCAFEAKLSKKEQSDNPWKRLAVDIAYVGSKGSAS